MRVQDPFEFRAAGQHANFELLFYFSFATCLCVGVCLWVDRVGWDAERLLSGPDPRHSV